MTTIAIDPLLGRPACPDLQRRLGATIEPETLTALWPRDKWLDQETFLMALYRLTPHQLETAWDLHKVMSLKPNWDGEGAEPPNDEALMRARETLAWTEASGFQANVDADVLGGVAIRFTTSKGQVWISLMNSGAATMVLKQEGTITSRPWDEAARQLLKPNPLEAWRASPQASREAVLNELSCMAASWGENENKEDASTLKAAIQILKGLE